jgi:autotransporter-associated beta strand protein
MTFNGVVSGGGTNGLILKVGVLTLGNANTYTGPTILESGVNLRLNSASGNAIPAGSMTYLRGGRIILDASEQIPDNNLIAWPSATDSRLVLNGFNETLGGLFDQTGNGPRVIEAATDFISDKPATLTLNIAAGTNFTYSGYLRDAPSGTGSQLTVIKKGLGTQILTGVDGQLNWSSNTIVQQGTLELRNAGAVNSLVIVSNGATFAFGSGVRTNGIEGAGNVVKIGTGTAAYQAGTFDVHTGPTTVSNGVLRVDGEISFSPVSVYSPGWLQGSGYVATTATLAGGSLSPGDATTPNTLSVSNLTAAAGATLRFDLQTDPTPGSGINDLLMVTNLSITGPVTIQINPTQPLSAGRYVIIQYINSGLGLNQLSLGAPFFGSRYQPSLDTSKPGEVAIVVGSAPAQVSSALTWQGGVAGNTWDIGVTTNWVDASILPDAFFNQDTVLFDDTSSAVPTVNLTVAAYPGSVSFNNTTKNYTLAGPGKITGTTGMTKAGAGTVTIQTGNDYTGNTVVNEGTLAFSGNNTLSGNSIVNSGTLSLSGSNTLAGALTVNATATAQLTGTNTLLSAVNALGGATRVNGGLLTVNSVGINNDAKLIVENGGRVVRNSGPINHGNAANTSGGLIEVAGAGSTITIGNQTINHGTATGSMSNLIVLRDGGAWLNQGNNYVMPNGAGTTGQGLIITNGGRFTWMTGGSGNFLLGHAANTSSNYVQVIGANSIMDLVNTAALYVGRNGTNNTLLIDAGLVTNANGININDNGAGLANGAWIINGGRYYGGGIGVGLNANATNSFLIVDNGFIRTTGLTVGNNVNSNAVVITGASDVGIGTLTAVRTGSPLHFRGGSVIATNGTIGNGQIFTAGDGVQTASFGVAGVFSATNGVVIPANSTLRGNGTINGSVTNNGTLRPGFADLATLTITNVLKLNNATVMRVAEPTARRAIGWPDWPPWYTAEPSQSPMSAERSQQATASSSSAPPLARARSPLSRFRRWKPARRGRTGSTSTVRLRWWRP